MINLEKKNESLGKRVGELETSKVISENVPMQLANEVDRLSQYTWQSNVIVRNVFLPENETNEQVNKKVIKIIMDIMKLPNIVDDVDKLHCVLNKEMGRKPKTLLLSLNDMYRDILYVMNEKS